MKRFTIAIALGATALFGGSAANASDNTLKPEVGTNAGPATELSSQHRRYHHRHHLGHHRRYYGSYGYAPRAYYPPQAYYAPQPYYYGGGPTIGFGFGGGHFGGHHGGHHW